MSATLDEKTCSETACPNNDTQELPPTHTNALSSIATVAGHIQDRANDLKAEREHLSNIQSKIKCQEIVLEDETDHTISARERYLTNLTKRHEKEVAVLCKKRDVRTIKDSLKTLQSCDIMRVEAQVATLRQAHDEACFTMYSAHGARLEMFERRIASKLNRMKRKRRKRDFTLDRLALDTDRIVDETENIRRESQRLRYELKTMDEVEVKDDEEIAGMAMQIRATLSKVSSIIINIIIALFKPPRSLSRYPPEKYVEDLTKKDSRRCQETQQGYKPGIANAREGIYVLI
jgi:hypothetical protein